MDSSLPEKPQTPAFLQVEQRARAFWPEIAAACGLPAEGLRFVPMQVNSRTRHSKTVLRVESDTGQDWVLRADFEQARSADCKQAYIKQAEFKRAEFKRARFERALAQQQAAHVALAGQAQIEVAAVLWQHPQQNVSLIGWVPGETLVQELALCGYGFGDRYAVLERAGRAVAALHGAGGGEVRQFWPKVHLLEIARQAEAVRAEELRLRRPKVFLGLCAYLHRAGRRARGERYRSGLVHGDLHMRNILMQGDRVGFIDFGDPKGATNGMVQRDLANFWLANCPDHLAQPGEVPGYGRIAKADWDAFCAGYGGDVTGDPVFQFHFALRLLERWRRLPAPGADLSPRGQAMIQGVEAVFRWLLEHEPGTAP